MHWRDIEEIAEHLEDNYSDDYSSNMKLAILKEMVTSLTDFKDHEVEVKGGNAGINSRKMERNKGRDGRKRVIIIEFFRQFIN